MADWLGWIAAWYWLPTVVAEETKHPRTRAIRAVNGWVGWTGIGWLAALAWAEGDELDGARPAILRALAVAWIAAAVVLAMAGALADSPAPGFVMPWGDLSRGPHDFATLLRALLAVAPPIVLLGLAGRRGPRA